MKLAYSTLACPAWTWQQAIAAARDYGYDGIEWRLIDGQVVSSDFPAARSREIKAAVAAAGLLTCALDTGNSLAHPPGPLRERNLQEVAALLQVAQALGTDILRVFPGKYPATVSDEQAIEWVVAGLNHLLPQAQATGVRIALELHDSFDWQRKKLRGTTTSTFVAQVLAQVAAPEVGVQWDLGNPYLEGETAEETWRNLPRERLIYVHTKDMQPTSKGEWQYVPSGEGVLPLPAIIDWLRNDGFDGWLSFEWEKKWHPELAEPEVILPHYVEYMRPRLV